jgi:hypothetical protein
VSRSGYHSSVILSRDFPQTTLGDTPNLDKGKKADFSKSNHLPEIILAFWSSFRSIFTHGAETGDEVSWTVPLPTGPTACFRATCRGTANPIPPRLPRAPIPAFGLLGPAGGPPLRPMVSSENSKNLPPNSIASEDKSSLPTSCHGTLS